MGSITQQVALKDVRFYAPIGFFEEERIVGNEFYVDVSVDFPFGNEDAEDLMNTLNYAELYELVCVVMQQERKLLESAAQEILEGIRNAYAFVQEVRVTVRKTTPPFGHDCAHAAVSLHYKV